MPIPFLLPALAAGGGLLGSFLSGRNQPQAPTFTQFQSPFESQLREQVNRGLGGQLSPVQAELFQQALARGTKSIEERASELPSGGVARLLSKFQADLATGQAQVGEQNRLTAFGQAQGLDAFSAQQNQLQFQTQLQEFMRQLQEQQQTQGLFGNIASAGFEGLLTQNTLSQLLNAGGG